MSSPAPVRLLPYFPDDVLQLIFSYLDLHSLAMAAKVCRHWQLIASNPVLIKHCKRTLKQLLAEYTISESHPCAIMYSLEGQKSFVPYLGIESSPGVLKEWTIPPCDVPAPVSFFHTTTFDLSGVKLVLTEGNKEFGSGFYTTCGDSLIPQQLIGEQWFSNKQKTKAWHTVRFSVRLELLEFAFLNAATVPVWPEMLFFLTHSVGYPHGGAEPNAQDLAVIDVINRVSKILIFPDDKTLAVAYGKKKERRSWMDYTKEKLGGGDYHVIVGPQQPDYMLSYRQYAFVSQAAFWLLNSCPRCLAHKNTK